MANLLDLPNELLSDIIGRQLEQSRLSKLAHINHRLHALTQPLLFRHATGLSSRQLLLLKRTLKEKPGLKKAIWSYGPVVVTETEGYILLEDFYNIPEFINLKKLQFRAVKFLPGRHQSHQSLFRWDILGQIEEIELAACESPRIQSPCPLINIFEKLPSVHTLTVTGILAGFAPSWCVPIHASRWLQLHSYKMHHTLSYPITLRLSGVENTVVIGHIRPPPPVDAFKPDSLQKIIQSFTNLTTLHRTNLVFVDQPLAFGPRKTLIDRSGLQIDLRCIEGTLQELVLTTWGDQMTVFPGEPLDLSRFTSLSILRISSMFLREWNGMFTKECDETKRTLHKRLPPNLETLQVDFSPPLGVFGVPGELGYDDHEHLLRWRWEWLLLFPTYKPSYFPKLRDVKMIEARPISKHEVIKWELTKDLAELSEKADINMDIWVCRHEAEKPEWARIKFRLFD